MTTNSTDIKKVEINLRRLIKASEKLIAEDDKVDIINSEGEVRNFLIENTYTVERYIPVMLSMLKQLNEKWHEQNKKLQQPQLNNNNISPNIFQISPQQISQTSSSQIQVQSTTSSPQSSDSGNSSSNSNTATQAQPTTSTSSSYTISKESLSEYSRKIDVIVGLVNKEKMNTPISNKPSIVRLQASNISHAKKMDEIQTVMKTRNKEDKKKIDQLIPNSNNNNTDNNYNNNNVKLINILNSNNNSNLSPTLKYRNTFQNRNSELKNLLGNKAGVNNGLFNNEELDEDLFEKKTEEQRQLQESLTNELLDYSKSLKNHSNTMSTKLSEEDKKLGELGQLVDTSSNKIQRQNQNLKDYTSSSTRDTLNYCLIIVFVLIVFISTYLLMKLSKKAPPTLSQNY